MASTKENPEVVREYLSSECSEGRVLGPLDPEEFKDLHTTLLVWQALPNRRDASMLWAASCTSFLASRWSSWRVYDESLVHLSYEDVTVDSVKSPTYIEVCKGKKCHVLLG